MKASTFLAAGRLALIGFAVGSLAGCTALAGAQPKEVTIHEQDFGRTVALHVGDTLTVDLLDQHPGPGSSVVWTADSSKPRILQRVSSNREAITAVVKGTAHYTAVFKAISSGSASVMATGAAHCEAMNPAFCPQHSGTISVAIDQP